MIDITHKNPDPKLSKYVRKISIFKSNEGIKYTQKLTPSPFTYLSYNHKQIPTSIFGEKVFHPDKRLHIVGPKTNNDIFVEYNGQLEQILIEFTGSGFYYLFHSSPYKLSNDLLNMDRLVPSTVTDKLENNLQSLDNIEQKIKLLEEFLHEKYFTALPFIDYIEQALEIIERTNGSILIEDIIEKIGISERQFDRKFREVVGISPKSYSKILQLHYVIKLMQSKKYSSIQDIAYRAEYYDLPHFAHRFKELTGFTPFEFINSNKHIALKYFTDL